MYDPSSIRQNEPGAQPLFRSALLAAHGRAARPLPPITGAVRSHLATMLSRLDRGIVELCTPGHRGGRGFTGLPGRDTAWLQPNGAPIACGEADAVERSRHDQ